MLNSISNLTPKGRERRDEILAAADVLFRQHGYEKTTLRMIAQEVGISCGHLQHFFKEKSQLLYALSDLLIKNLWDNSEIICHEWNDDLYVTYAFAVHWLFLVCSHLDDVRRVTLEYVMNLRNQQEFSRRFALQFISGLRRNEPPPDEDLVLTSVQMAFAAHLCCVQKYDSQSFSDEIALETSRSHIEILFLLLRRDPEAAEKAIALVTNRVKAYTVERLVKPFELTYEWYKIQEKPFQV